MKTNSNRKHYFIALTLIIGVLIFTAVKVQSQTFINYTTSNGLPDDFVTGIAIDTNNVKWACTANGVAKYNDTVWTTYTTANGLIDNYGYCIAVDKSNNVWVGTASGVSKFNGSTWTNYTTTDGLIDNNVNYIATATDGSVWFATQIGVSKYNGTTFTNFTTTDGLSTNAISYIAPDATGNIWFCTQMGGVSKYNGTSFTNFLTSNVDSLLDDNTFAIGFDQNNNRYIGTFYGITKLNSSDIWVNNYRQSDELYNTFVRDIKADATGNLWVGMFADYNFDGGISFFNGTNWYSYSVTDGLVNTQVIRIALDKQNKPWIATGGGISRFNGSVGIASNSIQPNIDIYPNPTNNLINIQCEDQIFEMQIVDTQGRVLTQKALSIGENQIQIDHLSAGIYFVQLANSSSHFTQKIMVQ